MMGREGGGGRCAEGPSQASDGSLAASIGTQRRQHGLPVAASTVVGGVGGGLEAGGVGTERSKSTSTSTPLMPRKRITASALRAHVSAAVHMGAHVYVYGCMYVCEEEDLRARSCVGARRRRRGGI